MCHSWSQISCQHQILIKYFLSNIFQNYFATHWRVLCWVNTIWVTDNVHHWSVWASHCLISQSQVESSSGHVFTASLSHSYWALGSTGGPEPRCSHYHEPRQHSSPSFSSIFTNHQWMNHFLCSHTLTPPLSPVSGEVSQCRENNSLVLSSECWVESLRAMVAGGGWVRNEQVIQHEQSSTGDTDPGTPGHCTALELLLWSSLIHCSRSWSHMRLINRWSPVTINNIVIICRQSSMTHCIINGSLPVKISTAFKLL